MDGAKVYNIHEKRTRLFLFFIVNVYVKICVWLHQKGEQCELPPWKYQRDDGLFTQYFFAVDDIDTLARFHDTYTLEVVDGIIIHHSLHRLDANVPAT